jgi:hypothetical protein
MWGEGNPRIGQNEWYSAKPSGAWSNVIARAAQRVGYGRKDSIWSGDARHDAVSLWAVCREHSRVSPSFDRRGSDRATDPFWRFPL